MTNELYEILSSLFPTYPQGSFTSTEDYPNTFFTYYNFNTPIEKSYDNNDFKTSWGYWINLYSVDPNLLEKTLIKARKLLKEKGWKIPTKGNDIASDSPNHSAKELTIYYMETEE